MRIFILLSVFLLSLPSLIFGKDKLPPVEDYYDTPLTFAATQSASLTKENRKGYPKMINGDKELPYLLDTNYEWQYYESYGNLMSPPVYKLHTYSLVRSDETQYPFAWKYANCKEWQINEDNITQYEGEEIINTTTALLREENDVIYLSLDNYSVDLNTPKPYGWKEIHIYNPDTEEAPIYEPEPGEEIVLYDFNVKVGDRYKTMIFGCLIVDAIVTSVSIEPYSNLNFIEPIWAFSDSVKVVEILPEIKNPYTDQLFTGDRYKIRYAEKIGNISMGNFISLKNEMYMHLDDGSYYDYTINNVYDEAGRVIYKGRNFDGFAAINNPSMDKKYNPIIYNILGQEIKEPLPGGIYIKNGKKFIGK